MGLFNLKIFNFLSSRGERWGRRVRGRVGEEEGMGYEGGGGCKRRGSGVRVVELGGYGWGEAGEKGSEEVERMGRGEGMRE